MNFFKHMLSLRMPTELAKGSVEGALYSFSIKNNSPGMVPPFSKMKLGIKN
jgi:hypothetical protein